MAERIRIINGARIRVPRRIARGRIQRPHPQVLRREREDRAYRWKAPGPMGEAGGAFMAQRLNGLFKSIYSGAISDLCSPMMDRFIQPLPATKEEWIAQGFTYAGSKPNA